MTKLPDTLHGLMRVALDDLRLCAKDPCYKIHMGSWHRPRQDRNGNEACWVCMAGAIMAQTLQVPPDQYAAPDTLKDGAASRKLCTVNAVRCGFFVKALRELTGGDAYEHYQSCREASRKYGHVDNSLLKDHAQALSEFPWREEDQPAWFEAWDEVVEKLKELGM